MNREGSLTIKAGQELRSLDQATLVAVTPHPAQAETAADIAELIGGLRKCCQPSDYYEFQRYLFSLVYRIEERRAQCSRIVNACCSTCRRAWAASLRQAERDGKLGA